ncbi:MAG: site-specific integrase [Hyphomicrobiaceae bacterium]|jgi:integrase|nr:site-specific integrase [Hyphomicrobiaceae bacterium]MDX2450901.1 site-specific integrase [Hyphomicrobiaceae bacterium]
MREGAPADAVHVFPGRLAGKPRDNVRRAWDRIRKDAKLEDVHFHDLRHSYASLLINDGASLPIIGRLLGHTQAQTTMRYAHLADDPLREATSRVGKIVGGAL